MTDLLISLHDKLIAGKDPSRLIEAIYNRYEEIGQAFHVDAHILTAIREDLEKLRTLETKGFAAIIARKMCHINLSIFCRNTKLSKLNDRIHF